MTDADDYIPFEGPWRAKNVHSMTRKIRELLDEFGEKLKPDVRAGIESCLSEIDKQYRSLRGATFR